LFSAGVQLPVMPFSEVVGNDDKDPPAQIEDTAVKVGVSIVDIVTEVVAVTPGQPPLGATV
jgi:hypothetical protein